MERGEERSAIQWAIQYIVLIIYIQFQYLRGKCMFQKEAIRQPKGIANCPIKKMTDFINKLKISVLYLQ